MKFARVLWILPALALILVGAGCSRLGLACGGETLSYSDVVARMTDMEALSVLPLEGEGCAQWSSWNRKSQYDAATGKYIDWGQNGDQVGAMRKEGNDTVLGEMEGPGVIWRIWSAGPRQGHIRIYLDGEAVSFSGYGCRSLDNPDDYIWQQCSLGSA